MYRSEKGCSTDGTDGTSMYLMIFILSQLLSGAGTTPLHTLGTSYIDENVDPKYTSIYIGIFYATIMLGPGIGSIIGGNMLNLYVDIKLVCHNSIHSLVKAELGRSKSSYDERPFCHVSMPLQEYCYFKKWLYFCASNTTQHIYRSW